MIRVNDMEFKRTQLIQAVAFANQTSKARKEITTVSLPGKIIYLKDLVFVTNKVKLLGERKTKIVLKEEGGIVVDGELHCESVTFLNKTKALKLAMNLLQGHLCVDRCKFVNATLKGVGRLFVLITNSSFVQTIANRESVVASFEGVGYVIVKATAFDGYSQTRGITVANDSEGQLLLDMSENERNLHREGLEELPMNAMSRFMSLVAPLKRHLPQKKLYVDGQNMRKVEKTVGRKWKRQTCEEVVPLLSLLDSKGIDTTRLLKTIATRSPLKAFQIALNEDFVTEDNSPVLPLEQALEWWAQKNIYFVDKVFEALDTLLRDIEIDVEVYDAVYPQVYAIWHTFHQRLSEKRLTKYLKAVASKHPLRAWYLVNDLTADSPVKDAMLLYLATKFSKSSWVSAWASNTNPVLTHFVEMPPPNSKKLRVLWANILLDGGKAAELKGWYEMLRPEQLPVDALIKFQYRFALNTEHALPSEKLDALLSNPLHEVGLRQSCKAFKGNGVLPGYVKRTLTCLRSIPDILRYLAPVFATFNTKQRLVHQKLFLALVDAVFNRSNRLPEVMVVVDHAAVLETCEVCYAEKLKGWNQMKLSKCSANHVYCVSCVGKSMSTGARELWGVCPGQDSEGVHCHAVASREEMELCGMDKERIYNILSVRYFSRLDNISNWSPCEVCDIGGGISTTTDENPNCLLCSVTVAELVAGDTLIDKKLLQGVKSSKVKRGKGVYRECFHCAIPIEKGDQCSTVACSICNNSFDFVKGPDNRAHRFDENGVAAQEYVPKKKGKLWNLGIFKTSSGRDLTLGSTMSPAQRTSVQRNAAEIVKNMDE